MKTLTIEKEFSSKNTRLILAFSTSILAVVLFISAFWAIPKMKGDIIFAFTYFVIFLCVSLSIINNLSTINRQSELIKKFGIPF
jgi:hypothetical protein